MPRSSSTSSSDRVRPTLGRIVLAAVFLLALGEAYSRFAAWYWGSSHYVHQPLTLHRIRQDASEYPGIKEKVNLRIDHLGLRSSAHSTRRDPDILALGSSTTFCGRLDQEDTFPERVARRIRESLEQDVVIGTAASPGLLAWHHARHAGVLLDRLPSVRCVVAMPGVADMNRWLRGTAPEVTEAMEHRLFFGDLWGRDVTPESLLPATRKICDLLRHEGGVLLDTFGLRETEPANGSPGQRDRLRRFRREAPKVSLPEDRASTLPATLSFYRDNLRRLCEACLGHDVELVLVTQPLLYTPGLTEEARALWWSGNLGPKTPTTPYLDEASYAECLARFNAVTAEVSREFDVTLVDLAGEIEDARGRYFHDTIHFNEEGAALAGQLVGDRLADEIAFGESPPDLVAEPIVYPGSIDPGLERLTGKVYYRRSFRDDPRPILVCLHAFSSDASGVAGLARAARTDGFFVVAPDLRGRGESDGRPDFGGREIQDVRDAVTAVIREYGDLVQPDVVVLEGFSGGGGNTLSALTKFPDAWAAGLSFFGISDYGRDAERGWYQTSAGARREALREGIGDPATPEGRDAYASRASVLGVANNRRARIHLFTDVGDTICLPDQSERFVAAAREAGLTNVTLHRSTDGRWGHRLPSWSELFAAHRLAGLDRLSPPEPEAPEERRYTVLGYCETDAFRCRLGDGNDAVATLVHEPNGSGRDLSIRFVTSTKDVHLTMVGVEPGKYDVEINGEAPVPVHAREGKITIPRFHGNADIRIRRLAADLHTQR